MNGADLDQAKDLAQKETSMNNETLSLLDHARQCFEMEIAALRATSEGLDERFGEVIHAIQATIAAQRKLIFTGVGKNVPICQKVVGTFNSIGVPASFLDPNQALHGDLGFCMEGDLAFFFSNSGETEDLLRLVPLVKRLGLRTVAVTQRADCSLVEQAELRLLFRVEREACPLNLAPTASTTAALALGDALAMTYWQVRGARREDFARYHPAGSIGKSLLLRVSEIMRQGDRFACLPRSCTVRDALLAMTQARCGTIALTEPDTGRLAGVFTDGDFRRCSLSDEYVLQRRAENCMTPAPKTVQQNALAVEVLQIFERSSVNDLIALDADGRPVGLVDGQDLPKLRIL